VGRNPKEIFMAKTAYPNGKTMIARALGLLEETEQVIQEAIDNHIYDQGRGEKPGPNCPYAGIVRDIDAFLAGYPAALLAQSRQVKGSPVRVIALQVTCMAADAEDVRMSLFNPDSTQPSWYYDHGIALGPVRLHDRAPTTGEDAEGAGAWTWRSDTVRTQHSHLTGALPKGHRGPVGGRLAHPLRNPQCPSTRNSNLAPSASSSCGRRAKR
jgi:hypothetical protein